MNVLANSLSLTSDLTLIISCIKRAVEFSSTKSLTMITRRESRQLLVDHVVKAVQQIVQDFSSDGRWKDEKDHVLSKAHGWMFISWMTTMMGSKDLPENFISMNTTFYLEVVRVFKFQDLMLQCLCRVKKEVAPSLTQEIMKHISDCKDEEDENFLLDVIEYCLKQLPRKVAQDDEVTTRFLSILVSFTCEVKHQLLQLRIFETLAEVLRQLFIEFMEECHNNGVEKVFPDFEYSVNLFTEKQTIIEFESKIKQFMNDAEITAGQFKAAAHANGLLGGSLDSLDSEKQLKKRSQERDMLKIILSVVCLSYQLMTCEWKMLFCWEVDKFGRSFIQPVKQFESHAGFFKIFTICLSMERYVGDQEDVRRLQDLIYILTPYFECQATSEEKAMLSRMQQVSELHSERHDINSAPGGSHKSLNEELEKAIFRIKENLFGDEKCFEWLLATEDLYQDKRWLECVLCNAKKFVSISTVKMLLDILCIMQETVVYQDGHHESKYKSLNKLVLDMLPFLTLHEQADIVIYNFNLVCLQFESCTDQSLFLCPGDSSGSLNWVTKMLTVTMNKIVNKAGASFSSEILTGIAKGALIAPYVTLKVLLMEAVKHAGHEKVICELLQTIPWFPGLSCGGQGHLLVKALKEVFTTLSSSKQEGQYLKLVGALMQPYTHPAVKTKENPLLLSHDVMKELIQPMLIMEDSGDVSPTLVLNVLMTALPCQTSPSQRHWILDEEPIEILFVLLEMYQDCIQFWQDWIFSDERGGETMDRNDFALDEAWTEMNVIVKMFEEYLIPILAEAIPRELSTFVCHRPWIEDHLSKLDWSVSVLIVPLLQDDMISCSLKLPTPIVHLVKTDHLQVHPLNGSEDEGSFWTVYFKSCALSNEVYGMYVSKLKDGHPEGTKSDCNCREIVESLVRVLPFSTLSQWQRLLNIAKELGNHGYLNSKEKEWESELVNLPQLYSSDSSSDSVVNLSSLLVSVLRCMSSKDWATPYVWNMTMKNYASSIKQLLLMVKKQDEFWVKCHLLAHLGYIAFKVIPEEFHENIAIVMLDVLNACLSNKAGSKDENTNSIEHLQHIINSIPAGELRTAMMNKIQKVVSNIKT